MAPLPGGETEVDGPGSLEKADESVLRATLDVSRELDLSGQIRVVTEHVRRWTGRPARGFADAAGPAGRMFSVECDPAEPPDEPRATSDASEVLDRLGGRRHAELERWPGFAAEAVKGGGDGPAWVVAVEGGGGQTAGIVLVGGATPGEHARRKVLELVEYALPYVTNALEVRRIRALVFQDDTAKCFNRRYFEEFLSEELARASRFRSPVSLIFFDMDNLKQINTRFGHAMGSRVLLEVSDRVRSRVRRFDKLFRFGGDEFCIVLPETEWHGALEVAERVRESVAGEPFLGEMTPEGATMTASFGIASFPLHARTRAELIERADRAMQGIKSGTKNSIAIAGISKSDVS